MYYTPYSLMESYYKDVFAKKVRKFLIYVLAWSSPVLIFGQILTNLLYLTIPAIYFEHAESLSYLFGFNLVYCFAFIALSWLFRFCRFTRWSAWGELAIALAYIIAGSKNAYNTWLLIIQIAIGAAALIATLKTYMRKHPNCRMSKLKYFIKLVFATASFTGALDKYLHNFEITEKKKINADKY